MLGSCLADDLFDKPPWRQARGKLMFFLPTSIQMPLESGGICERLTSDLPLGYLQGGHGRHEILSLTERNTILQMRSGGDHEARRA
jgi:hypothetical protein